VNAAVAWSALLVILIAVYITWTAGRLDRMHARVDAAWAALDAQLVRRAFAAQALLPQRPAGPSRDRLATAASAVAGAGEQDRERVENDLSRALQEALPLLPAEGHARAELEAAAARVALARSFHNSAVHDTQGLRRRKVPRLLRLAGHRSMPAFFDVDDTVLADP
jgi:hypothetical protein